MRRSSLLALALLIVGAMAAPAIAHAQFPEKFENLKVLPKNIPRDSLLGIMRGFTVALGQRCTYCHVSEPGPNGRERLLFAKDDKPTKLKARFMLRMVDSLNDAVLPNVPHRRNPPVVVQCVTCHRGLAVPTTLTTVLTAAVDSFGVDSAESRYEHLRQDMESGRYDLSEGSVSQAAGTLAGRGKTADAIALLQMNQRYHPNSAEIDFELGQLYEKQGDRDKAITAYRTALVKQPHDPRVMQRLKALGVAPDSQ